MFSGLNGKTKKKETTIQPTDNRGRKKRKNDARWGGGGTSGAGWLVFPPKIFSTDRRGSRFTAPARLLRLRRQRLDDGVPLQRRELAAVRAGHSRATAMGACLLTA